MRDRHGPTEGYHEPGWYEIRLKGHLDQRWAARFESMGMSHACDGTTILLGPVVDQAALYGLLRKVRDLGIPLISVNRLQLGQTDESDSSAMQSSASRQS